MKKKSLIVATCVALALVMGLAGSALADTANLNPTADSYVKTNQASNNFGTEDVLTVKSQSNGPQNWRALLKFDLSPANSGIPAGSTINGASLVLYMTVAPGSTRNYELHYGDKDGWTETGVTYTSAFNSGASSDPGLTALLDTIPTGNTADVSLTWGANGPNSATEALTSRVALEFGGSPNPPNNQIISLIVKDQTESNNPNRLASFASKDQTTLNKPVLVIDYTPPVACTEATFNLDAFNLDADKMPIDMGTIECFQVQYKIKAGCKDLSYIKTQGGFGSNLDVDVDNIQVSKGTITKVKTPGKSTNTVITWEITEGLAANEPATLTATVCTGTNPKGKQEFTSCGLKPITGNWSSTAVVAEDGSIIHSTPPYTDRLEVEVICPGSIYDEVLP